MVYGADSGDVAAMMLNDVLRSWRAYEREVMMREEICGGITDWRSRSQGSTILRY